MKVNSKVKLGGGEVGVEVDGVCHFVWREKIYHKFKGVRLSQS